jgi:hypothetical protein
LENPTGNHNLNKIFFMKLVQFLFAAFIAVFVIACSNDSAKTESTQTPDPNAQTAPVAPVDGQVAPAPAADPAQNQMQVQPQQSAPAGIQAPAAGGTTAVAPGTNPPHGQPGHRCDIAVGAPLPK